MKMTEKNDFFSYAGISLAAFCWLAMILAMAGFFYVWILIIIIFLLLSFLGFLVFKNREYLHFSRNFILVLILSFAAIIVFSYFTVPTIFTGRDQGSLSVAAISLTQNHSLKSSFPAEQQFFKIYGAGKALNFPGFNYSANGDLMTQFPIGYISWLAAFYSLFGLFGLVLANAVSFFAFLISFFCVSRNYLSAKRSLVAFVLILTSFIFSWFFKFTLSENLALALVWFGIAQFIFYWKEEKKINLAGFLISFSFLFFVRIEAIAFLTIAAFILWLKYKKNNLPIKKIFHWETIPILAVFFATFIASLYSNSAFYITFAKGFLNSLNFFKNGLSGSQSHPLAGIAYIFKVFSAYALISYIILGLIGFFYFLKKKNYEKLIPFFILLPVFIYLFNPSITPDHPWMLRRFVFAVAPVGILYSIIFLSDFLKKPKFFYFFSFFLLLSNLIIFIPYIGIKENPNLLKQTKKLSAEFKDTDLILIDRNASGNPWVMLPGPMNVLFKKQAVYFFNPEDLKKLDLSAFTNVYLIIPDDNTEFYKKSELSENIVFYKDYFLENDRLSTVSSDKNWLYNNPVTLPVYQKNYIYGKIHLLKK